MIGEKISFYENSFGVGKSENGIIRHYKLKCKPFSNGYHHCCVFLIQKKDGSLITKDYRLIRFSEKKDDSFIEEWSYDDIAKCGINELGIELTTNDSLSISKIILQNFNPSQGINWNVIEDNILNYIETDYQIIDNLYINDLMERVSDKFNTYLDPLECWKIGQRISKSHETGTGINWDSIDIHISDYLKDVKKNQ